MPERRAANPSDTEGNVRRVIKSEAEFMVDQLQVWPGRNLIHSTVTRLDRSTLYVRPAILSMLQSLRAQIPYSTRLCRHQLPRGCVCPWRRTLTDYQGKYAEKLG